jgi:hypothetical protein
MKKILALALCIFSNISFAAHAMTAGDLQDICSGQDKENKAACKFYIYGVSEGIDIGTLIADGKTNAPRVCIPEGTSMSSKELAVKIKLGQDLMVYPEDKKLDASGVLAAIFSKTYPCKTSGNKH